MQVLGLTNILLVPVSLITAYLSFDGVAQEMDGSPASNFKAALFGAAIGLSYFAACYWLINVVAFLKPRYLWLQLPPVVLILGLVTGASSVTNLNAIGRDVLIAYDRNQHIAERSVWNDGIKALARRTQGLDATLTSVAEGVRVVPREEERSGKLSGGQPGCGTVCRTLYGMVERVEAQRPVLRAGVAQVEDLSHNIDEAMTRLREAMTISDPAERRVALEAANDDVRGFAIALRESLPIDAIRGLAMEFETASVLGPTPPGHSEEGYTWARSVLARQGEFLHGALDPIVEGMAVEVPVYTEKNGFQIAIESGLTAAPSLFLAAVGIDAISIIVAAILIGAVRSIAYQSPPKKPLQFPGDDGDLPLDPKVPDDLDAVRIGAELMLSGVQRGAAIARQHREPPILDIEPEAASIDPSPQDRQPAGGRNATEASDDFDDDAHQAEFATAAEPYANGHDFGGPYPNSAKSRAQTAKARREARKNGGAA